jgi:hypothetical protein
MPDVSVPSRFGVSHILVTGRWGGGRVASVEDIYAVTLHEMGHALGLMGHSDDPYDLMYPSIASAEMRATLMLSGAGLISARDRNTMRKLYEHGNRPFRGRRGRR